MTDNARKLEGVIRDMLANGHHYPDEWLIALAEILGDMGGEDFIAEWEGEAEAAKIDAARDRLVREDFRT